MNMRDQGRIIIVRNGAIGDTILLAPVIHALRTHFPAREILLLGRWERVSLLVGPSFATRALGFDLPGIHTLYGPTPALPPEVSGLFGSASVVLWYGEDRDEQLAGNLIELCPGRVVVHSPHPPEHRHITDHLMLPLGWVNVPRPLAVPPLEVSATLPDDLEDLLMWSRRGTNRIVIHPGASRKEKCLPVSVWADVLHALCPHSLSRIVVLSGPEEEKLGIDLCAAVHDLDPMLIHNRPLPDLVAVLRHADLFLGHDSGITHLAGAVGCRTVAVFRSTDPRMWAPPRENVEIIEIGPHEEECAARRIPAMLSS